MYEKSRTAVMLSERVQHRVGDLVAAHKGELRLSEDGPSMEGEGDPCGIEGYLEWYPPYMVRVLTDNEGALHFSFAVVLSPHIIVNTRLHIVEGVWGSERVAAALPVAVCNQIDEVMKRIVPTIS